MRRTVCSVEGLRLTQTQGAVGDDGDAEVAADGERLQLLRALAEQRELHLQEHVDFVRYPNGCKAEQVSCTLGVQSASTKLSVCQWPKVVTCADDSGTSCCCRYLMHSTTAVYTAARGMSASTCRHVRYLCNNQCSSLPVYPLQLLRAIIADAHRLDQALQ